MLPNYGYCRSVYGLDVEWAKRGGWVYFFLFLLLLLFWGTISWLCSGCHGTHNVDQAALAFNSQKSLCLPYAGMGLKAWANMLVLRGMTLRYLSGGNKTEQHAQRFPLDKEKQQLTVAGTDYTESPSWVCFFPRVFDFLKSRKENALQFLLITNMWNEPFLR